jgi:DnaJ-class molecular chaperone
MTVLSCPFVRRNGVFNVEKCSGCAGRGELPCPTCNKNNNREPGFYTSQTMIVCSVCHGRGLIARTDGSDSICGNCKGEGRLPCSVCQSRGLVKCEKCRGDGSLLTRFPHTPKTSSEPANHCYRPKITTIGEDFLIIFAVG